MYLPTTDPRQRKDITEEFFHYRRLTQTQLWDHFSAFEHWAKIEVFKKFPVFYYDFCYYCFSTFEVKEASTDKLDERKQDEHENYLDIFRMLEIIFKCMC